MVREKVILLVLHFLFFFKTIEAQDIDTLQTYFNSIDNDSIKVAELLLTTRKLARRNPEYAIGLGRNALDLAQKNKFLLEEGVAHQYIGTLYKASSNYDSSKWYYIEAIRIFDNEKDSMRLSDVYSSLGGLLQRSGDFENSGVYLFKALAIREALMDVWGISASYNSLGIFYSLQNNFHKSIGFYRKAIKLRQEMDMEYTLSNSYNNLGIAYGNIEKFDSAMFFYKKSFDLRIKQEAWMDVAFSYINMAGIHHTKLKYDSAILLADLALKIGDSLDVVDIKSLSHLTLGDVYMSASRYATAENHLLKSLNYTQKTKDLERYSLLTNKLQKLYAGKGAYQKAYTFLQKYQLYKDSLVQTENVKAFAEIEEKYEGEKKDKQITALELDKQKTALILAEANNQRNVLFFVVGIVALIATFLFYMYRNKRKTSTLLLAKNEQIEHSLEEREILLKEIHHRVKNNLQIISSLLNLQADSLSDEAAVDAVKEGQNRVKSMALIHQKLYSAEDIRGVDVQGYLENLTHDLFNAFGVDRDQIECRIDTNGLKLDIDTVIPLGLIMNELVTNTLKYAFEKSNEGLLEIKLKEENDKLNVLVIDNGKGIDEKAMESSNSFGWKMIHSLGRKLKADINVIAQDGTTVELSLARYKLVV